MIQATREAVHPHAMPMLAMLMDLPPAERRLMGRFAEAIEMSRDGCALWTGSLTRNGYGRRDRFSRRGGRTVKVYVASSWRNPIQPDVVRLLRRVGHDVYDFREPTPGNHGFSWHEIDPTIPRGPADLILDAERIRAMLAQPAAEEGFTLDMGALRWCDACVLVLPCGRSAHLEAGWAAGAGKITVGLLAEGEPDLMWKMLDSLCVTPAEVALALADFADDVQAAREAAS